MEKEQKLIWQSLIQVASRFRDSHFFLFAIFLSKSCKPRYNIKKIIFTMVILTRPNLGADLDSAVNALKQVELIKEISISSERFIRLVDAVSKSDRQQLEDHFSPSSDDPAESDDLYSEIAKLVFHISPQVCLCSFLHFYVDAIEMHCIEFATILLRRYGSDSCSEKLKSTIRTHDFLHFICSMTQ
jgi:hypothetical protein